MAYLDQKEIANFLAQELFYQQFITLEGLNSGVPTRTTPTLTPTTLRSIEQTFIELQSKPESHENEAGFVPPLVHSIGNNQYISTSEADIYPTKSQNMWHSSLSQSSSDSNTRSTPPLTTKTSLINNTPTRRNMGGRKPAKDLNISPEEEERRRVRRERNKAAAARCRKRRVDHTNQLVQETDDLEQKKQNLNDEIHELRNLKNELEFILESHKSSLSCRIHSQSPPDVKPFSNYTSPCTNGERIKIEMDENDVIECTDGFTLPPPAKRIMLSSTVPISKPSRPNSLNVISTAMGRISNVSDMAGISITTPSSGLHFNFDSLMGGGTGLTPVSAPLVPSCSSQQRNIPLSAADMTSPDACGPSKLVSL